MKKLFLFALAFATVQSMDAKLVTKTVPYEDNGTKLQGYLAYDDAKTSAGKVPGVLVVPEWWGLNDYAKDRANQLAELGYVAFAVDMYGEGKTTKDPKQAGEWASAFYGNPLMADRARVGLQQLLQNDRVDQTKVAAIGFCFGGSTVQALAYSGAPLAAIASFHGGPVPAPESATGKVKTKFLIMNGAIDKMVTAEDRADLEKSLEAAGIDYQSIDYAHALHAFTNPNADELAKEAGMVGKIGYNEAAAGRSWKQMQIFFDEVFGARK